jgi:glutaminyl-tRNA synthetase
MPTLSGMRRRGYTPEAIRAFCDIIGVAKTSSIIDVAMLEFCLREDLNKRASRYMAVLNPIKVVITNYPEGQTEELDAVNNPEDESAGTRKVPFTRELFIERDDFFEVPPPKYHRLYPGNSVRLRYAYIITCDQIVKDESGNIIEVHCSFDPETKSGHDTSGRKVKGTIHWVSATHAKTAEVRMYDRLFSMADPDNVEEGKTFLDHINPDSLQVLPEVFIEPSLTDVPVGTHVQFERLGYFISDKDAQPGKPVFNRTVTLRDSWAKIVGKK